jgi:outer membrane protein
MRLLKLSAALAAVLGAALPAMAAGLSEIYEIARSEDAQFAAALYAASAGREKGVQGRALLLPAVNVSANTRRNYETTSTTTGHSTYQSGAFSVNASQPLMRQQYQATAEQGDLQARQAEQQLKLAEQDLMLRVARAFFDVLQAQDALATVGAQKAAFAQQLAQATRSYQVGMVPVTDVNEAQARYDLTLAQEISARNDLEVKRSTLEKAINRPLPPLAALDPGAEIEVVSPQQLQSLRDSAAQGATQVAIGVTAEQIARLEVEKQDAGHNPTIDAVASVGVISNANYAQFGGQHSSTAAIGIEVALPLYQGGAISSRAREAVANLGRAQSDLDNARRQATLDARQAYAGVESGLAMNRALQQAVKSGESQVLSTRRGMEVGLRVRVDLLNAEQQLFTSRRDLSAARYQTLVSTLQLKAAAGVISEQDLKTLDALLKE